MLPKGVLSYAHEDPGAAGDQAQLPGRLRHPRGGARRTPSCGRGSTPATPSARWPARGSSCPRSRPTPTSCGTTGSATSTRTCSRTARSRAPSTARPWSSPARRAASAAPPRSRSPRPAGSRCSSPARRRSSTRSRTRSRPRAATAYVYSCDLSDYDAIEQLVRADARRPPGDRHAHQQRGPLDPALGEALLRPLPRLRAHRPAQLPEPGQADARAAAAHDRARLGPHRQRLLDRRADEPAALLGLRGLQVGARRVDARRELGDDRRRRRRSRRSTCRSCGRR